VLSYWSIKLLICQMNVGVSEAVSKSETVGVIVNVCSRKLRFCNTNISTSIAEHYFVVGISISKSKCWRVEI